MPVLVREKVGEFVHVFVMVNVGEGVFDFDGVGEGEAACIALPIPSNNIIRNIFFIMLLPQLPPAV